MITDVAIDLDGVMYDFASLFHDYAEERMNIQLPRATRWDFYREWGMSDDDFQTWLSDATVYHDIFNIGEPIYNAIQGWDLLRELGVKLHVLTHRHPESYEQTGKWLNRHGLEPDSLHFGKDKTIIKTLAKDECASIDDHFVYYHEYKQAGVISFLMTQPWNMGHTADRVTDLVEFAQLVKLYNDYHRTFAKKQPSVKSAPSPYYKGTDFYLPKKKDYNEHEQRSTPYHWWR